MFTYLRQSRHIRLLREGEILFPSDATVTFQLGPPQLFGAGTGPIRALRVGSSYQMHWNANTDRSSSFPDPPFERVRIERSTAAGALRVDGDHLTFAFRAESEEDVVRWIQTLLFVLPSALFITLPEPPHILITEGSIGDVPFRVEHIRSVTPLIVLTDESLAQRVADGLEHLSVLTDSSAKRILAAARYVHTAARLLGAGYSSWEFMAEALLNFSKALEVAFGDTRDSQRSGLRAIKFEDSEIESRFIPVTLLRDSLDVAHPKLAQLDSDRLSRLYLFLVGLERDFQNLLAKMITAFAAGSWQPDPATLTTLAAADLSTLDRILAADEARRQAEAAKAQPG